VDLALVAYLAGVVALVVVFIRGVMLTRRKVQPHGWLMMTVALLALFFAGWFAAFTIGGLVLLIAFGLAGQALTEVVRARRG
jgi:hypothetical protein